MHRLLIAVRSLAAELGLQEFQPSGSTWWGSIVVMRGVSCSKAHGIFPDQGSNPCPLHWQVDSLPLSHQGHPLLSFPTTFVIYSWLTLPPTSHQLLLILCLPVEHITTLFTQATLCPSSGCQGSSHEVPTAGWCLQRWCSPRRGERGGGEAVLSVRDCLSHSSTGHWEHLRQDLMPWNSPGREEQGQGVRSALSEVFFFHWSRHFLTTS